MKSDANYNPEFKSRWNSYTTYRYILLAWMMNQVTVGSAPVDMSHNGFYIQSVLYMVVAIFVGVPLVYSEICIAQYTNCSGASMWNFCPILRGVGYGTIYLTILKTIYNLVLTSWYLEYMFYAALDPPPWFTCEDCGDPKCMIKRVNVSLFQHCIEAQNVFNEDCGIKTSSSCFFEQEIGNNTTINRNCAFLWKMILISTISSIALFLILIKKERVVKIITRAATVYMVVVLFVLFCVALSTSGTWYASKIGINWEDFEYKNSFYTLTQAMLACGTGCGVIGFLSRDISFRSPATMTAVMISISSIFITFMLALIIFSGIKTVSYYHGEEENVLEMGESMFFNSFASVSEILSYFDNLPLWGFVWFSTVFVCLLVNTSISCLFLIDFILMNMQPARKYNKISSLIMIFVLWIISWPFFCLDLTIVLVDVTEIIQITSSLIFSIGVYWIYGYQKHNIDITFMIGVKASVFWKIAWITNPIWIFVILVLKCSKLLTKDHKKSLKIDQISIKIDTFLLYLCLGVYIFIILVGTAQQIKNYYIHDKIRNLLRPTLNWGPRDKILFRSRLMFVPEIMTREFLYRQVKIHGYSRRTNVKNNRRQDENMHDFSPNKLEWSALTSN